MSDFIEATRTGDARKYIARQKGGVLMVYSPTSMEKYSLGDGGMVKIKTDMLGKDQTKLDEFIEGKSLEYTTVVGYGGGTAIDIAKYLAFGMRAKLVIIPSMLSTNAYATNKVSLLGDERKRTVEAKMADRIIFDMKILQRSMTENLYGFADIFSIYTALNDWRIARKYNGEIIDDKIYMRAQAILAKAVLLVERMDLLNVRDSLMKIYTLIGEAGKITNDYGNGRPESGSEHIFAKTVEEMIKIPHGISVSVGIVCMSILQNEFNKEIFTSLCRLGMLKRREMYGLDDRVVDLALKKLAPRADRFTVVDILGTAKINTRHILKILDSVK